MYRYIFPAIALIAGTAALSADNYHQRQDAKDQAELAKALTGFTPGRPTSCIPQNRVRDTQRVGDTILYKVSSRQLYRTDTGGGCFGLRNGDAMITKSFTGQFCRGDIIRTVDLPSRVDSGSCTFGDFTPYTK
ncbi:MAG: hypothetical protein ABIS14_07810 [Sphingomonas sp.]